MKLCMVGNSHMSALKRAWDTIHPEFDDIDITFFASRATGMSAIQAQGDRLVPGSEQLKNDLIFTSGGKPEIVPQDYDVFLIVGLGCTPYFHRQIFYSHAVQYTALHDHFSPSLAYWLLKSLRLMTDKPVFLAHDPMPAHKTQETGPPNTTAYRGGLRLANSLFFRDYTAALVEQPEETIVAGYFTRPSFSRNSRRLAIGDEHDGQPHVAHDMIHMNDEYGALWMRAFVNKTLRG